MMVMWWTILLACGGGGEPEIVCPELTTLKVMEPVQGGKKIWCERRNGKRNGPFREHRADGSLYKEGAYFHERLDGAILRWHENGIKAEEAPYDKGKLNGTLRRWDETGQLIAEEVWVDGKQSEAEADPE